MSEYIIYEISNTSVDSNHNVLPVIKKVMIMHLW